MATRNEIKERLREVLAHWPVWKPADIERACDDVDGFKAGAELVIETQFMGQRGGVYTGADWVAKANSGSSRVVYLGRITDAAKPARTVPDDVDYGGVLGADGQVHSDADPGL